MSLNATPSADRVHIGFFGIRNAGKSSLVNALTGQEMSVVSPIAGTTTDPVRKAMELLPVGPVVILDTPGLDDEGDLGEKRVRRTAEALNRTDLAVIVRSDPDTYHPLEKEWESRLSGRGIPYLEVISKADLLSRIPPDTEKLIHVSAATGYGIHALKEALGRLAVTGKPEKQIVADLLKPGDSVVLVMPIDASAPKGRLILPQVQTLRELLDGHYTAVVCQPEEIRQGVRPRQSGGSGGPAADFLFHPVRPLQGRPGKADGQREQAFRTAGRRPDPDLRGMHASQAVPGYRDGEDPGMDRTVHRQKTGIRLFLRQFLSRGSVSVPADRSLRRMHDQRAGDAVAAQERGGTGRPDGQLRDRDRIYARDPEAQPFAVSGDPETAELKPYKKQDPFRIPSGPSVTDGPFPQECVLSRYPFLTTLNPMTFRLLLVLIPVIV